MLHALFRYKPFCIPPHPSNNLTSSFSEVCNSTFESLLMSLFVERLLCVEDSLICTRLYDMWKYPTHVSVYLLMMESRTYQPNTVGDKSIFPESRIGNKKEHFTGTCTCISLYFISHNDISLYLIGTKEG